MTPRRAPKLLLVSFIAVLGLAVQPLNRDASAANRPAYFIQHGGNGGSTDRSHDRAVVLRVAGDPDDYTQTGGSEPKPVTPDSSSGRSFFQLLMDIVRGFGILVGPR